MDFRASHKYAHISPRKANQTLRLIRGVRSDRALALLSGAHNHRTGAVHTRAGAFVAKVLESAIANAREKGDKDREELYVAEARAEMAPTKHLRRMRARARGMGSMVRRAACHIHVTLATYA